MALLHLGMVVYDLICIILIFVGVLGEDKEFKANWRKIEPLHMNRSILPPSTKQDTSSCAQHPSYCLLESGRQTRGGSASLRILEEKLVKKTIKGTQNSFLEHSSLERRIGGRFWRIGKSTNGGFVKDSLFICLHM